MPSKLAARIKNNSIYISNTGCILWTGGITVHGYGYIYHKGKQCRVHRLVYELNFPDFDNTLDVLHSCDNKLCINIQHLRAGTSTENTYDMFERRFPFKLTREECEDIKGFRSMGKTYTEIAEMYRVSSVHVRDICLGLSRTKW